MNGIHGNGAHNTRTEVFPYEIEQNASYSEFLKALNDPGVENHRIIAGFSGNSEASPPPLHPYDEYDG